MMAFIDDNPVEVLWRLVRDVFFAVVATAGVYAVYRIANGLMLGSRITALREMGEAYTPEEREVLIHRIKHDSLHR